MDVTSNQADVSLVQALERAKHSISEMSAAMPNAPKGFADAGGLSTQNKGVSEEKLAVSAKAVESVVNSVTSKSLSFSIEADLSRMVVAVRAVGSDEIIRQFPPEEFLTVAKFIAAQNPELIDEDYLKGVLFDQYT